MRPDEGRLYLEIVSRAIRGLATSHYSADVIDAWVPPLTDERLRELMLNADGQGSRLNLDMAMWPWLCWAHEIDRRRQIQGRLSEDAR